MAIRSKSILANVAAFAMVSTGLFAQEVTLNSMDGTLSITGELIEFSDENYVIASNIGNLTIPTDAVTCVGEACPALMPRFTEFSISGSRELALNLMPTLLDGFAESLELDITRQNDENGNPQVLFVNDNGDDVAKISFVMRGSSQGLQNLLDGTASLALTTRQVRDAEASAFARAGLGDITAPGLETILALDGLVVVTSARNKVHIVRDDDIARIFSGQISDWSELGGTPGPINLYVRPENSGTGSIFAASIMRPSRTGFSLKVNVLGTDADVAEAVAADPNGIGFTSYSNLGNANPASLLGVCGIQSPATAFTIQAEEYPFSRRMYLYKLAQDVPPLVELFLEYLGTNEAQELIGFSGFVGQGVTEVPVNDQGLRFLSAALPSDADMTLEQLQSMMVDLSTAQRLTITYRFEQGTSRLDSRAEGDIRRLVELLQGPELAGKQIILLGFTDSVGTGAINEALSVTRAEQVRTAILNASGGAIDPARILVRGYGELSPLGCNEVVEGRRINRRVEVWTR